MSSICWSSSSSKAELARPGGCFPACLDKGIKLKGAYSKVFGPPRTDRSIRSLVGDGQSDGGGKGRVVVVQQRLLHLQLPVLDDLLQNHDKSADKFVGKEFVKVVNAHFDSVPVLHVARHGPLKLLVVDGIAPAVFNCPRVVRQFLNLCIHQVHFNAAGKTTEIGAHWPRAITR